MALKFSILKRFKKWISDNPVWSLFRKIAQTEYKSVLKLPAPSANGPKKTSKQYEEHPSQDYMGLKLIFRDMGRLNAIIETLGRDFLTSMPTGAYKSRLGQIAFLHRRMHEELANEKVATMMEHARKHENKNPKAWDQWDHANLREMEIMYRHHCQVPSDVIEQRARLSYEGRRIHSDVMRNNDWETAKTFLEDTIETQRRIAESKCLLNNEHETEAPYQALLREFIPSIRITDIDSYFSELSSKLKTMLPQILELQEKEDLPERVKGPFPEQQQMWLNKMLLKNIGFDFTRGGLYQTGFNPVEGGTPEDTHLVIHNVDLSNFLISMKSTLHEGGHGLYLQGLPRKIWRYQPVGQDLGTAVHESQALMIEMILGRKREFFQYLSPRLEGLFQKFGDTSLQADNLWKLKNWVKPGPDRKTADEVTYFFHVNLRFKLERQLFSGDLKVKDLPEAWNAEIKDVFDIEPRSHAEGCLQDVHWFVGKFGYFPSYTLGHMMAAQTYNRMRKDIQNIPELLQEGNMLPVRDWLNDKIHKHGCLYRPMALIEDVTGESLKPAFLLNHLEERYIYRNA